MDAGRFDTIVKAVGADATRRAILDAWAAVTVGGVLTLLGRQADALASTCPEGHQRCGKQCYDPSRQDCCRGCKRGPKVATTGYCFALEGC